MLPVTKSDPATVGPPMSVQLQLAGQPLALTGVLVAVAAGTLVFVALGTTVFVGTSVLVALGAMVTVETGVLVLVGVGLLPPVTLTAVKVTVLDPLRLCAVTAKPASNVPVSPLNVTVEPGTSVQAVPLLDV
jgi:hypothetical protein